MAPSPERLASVLVSAVAGLSLLFAAMPAQAQHGQGGKHGRDPPERREQRPPVRYVHPRPMPPPGHIGAVVEWNHGYWHHGYYGGRLGWWWVVGPSWYFFNYPVYPYWYPPQRTEVIVVEQAQPSGPPPQAYWYWCDEPKGYYPYVPECPAGWQPVPAAPPPAAPAK